MAKGKKTKKEVAPATQELDYNKYVLDPKKKVEVDINRYVPIINTIKAAQANGTKVYREVVFTWFSKADHSPLSKEDQAKLPQDELEAGYYNTIDIDATEKNVKYFLDDVAFASVKLEGEFRGIFKDNIDNGNRIDRPVDGPKEQLPENAG